MNRKKLQRLLCIAGCACVLLVLASALLMHDTDKEGQELVAFSHPSGFYDGPFYLELSGEGRIYYTLDSSEPDEHSTPYTGPIRIVDASPNENVYSMITDVSLDFRRDLVEAAGTKIDMGYRTPSEPIDKATVVRAVTIDGEGNRSKVASAVYFVGYDDKTGYDGLNIVSIVTDPKNLFDYNDGIYVTGKLFDDILVDGKVPLPIDQNFGVWQANYRQKGIEWEREAYVCFFDAQRNDVVSGNFGIRIQGGSSRGLLPKNLNIFARKQYGPESIPAAELFGEKWLLHSVNLHAGAQGMSTKIHDYLVNTLAKDMHVFTKEYVPCEVFLDGEYWGVYWMTPRYKADYLREKYNIYESNAILYKPGDDMEIGEPEDKNLLIETREVVSDGDMSDPEAYARACELIDIDSCLDYFALEIYIANPDWPNHNQVMWRTRDIQNYPYADGKWRWIVHDVNMALSLSMAKTDFVDWAINRNAMFASLMDNADFADALYDRLADLAEDRFDPEKMRDFVNEYEIAMRGAMRNEYMRFYDGDKDASDFHRACDNIINFFEVRHDYILAQCAAWKEEASEVQ